MTAKTQKGQGLIGFLWTYSTKRAKEEAGSSDVHTKCQLCSMLILVSYFLKNAKKTCSSV